MIDLFGTTSYICLALYAICIALPANKVMIIYIVAAAFTTTAVADFGGSSILVYQPIWLILALKVALLSRRCNTPVLKPFLVYLIFAFCSITLALFNTDVWVFNTDSIYAQVRFSSQQFTQWAYMLIAVSTVWCTAHLIRIGEVSICSIMRTLDVAMVIVLTISFLQLVVPADIMTEYIRNSVHTSYTTDSARLSSTFQEPSMLSLYIVPLMGLHAIRLVDMPNAKSTILLLLSLIVCLLNHSSAAFLGMFVMLVIVFARQLMLGRKMLHSSILIGVFGLTALVGMGLAGVFDEAISILIDKIQGNGVSGEERLASVAETFAVFLSHPIFGVGWGTIRAAFLFDMLAETGVVGFALFLAPFVRACRNHAKNGSWGAQCFCYLAIAVVLLSVVSSEIFYPTFWIVVGMGFCGLAADGSRNEELSLEGSL